MSGRSYQCQFSQSVVVDGDRKYHEALSLSLLGEDRERVTLRKGSIVEMRNQEELIIVKLFGSQRVSGGSGRWEYYALVVPRSGTLLQTRLNYLLAHAFSQYFVLIQGSFEPV
jgi:hypothetical protein